MIQDLRKICTKKSKGLRARYFTNLQKLQIEPNEHVDFFAYITERMGSTSENLCLQWHDFESNVTGAFLDLRSDGDFFDVTLGCADSPRGQSIQVF